MMLASPTFSSLARTNSWKKVPKSQLNQFAMVSANMDCSAPEEVESFSPGKRYCHTAVVLDDSSRIIVFGGGSVIPDREYLNDTWELNTETMDWKELKCQGEIPAGRLGHTANLVNNKMYVFGGYDGESLRNELFVLDLETCQWTEVKDPEGNGPTPRSQHSSAVLGDKMIIFGGYDSEEQNDVFVFDTVTEEWAEIDVQGKNLPVSRYQHTSCCTKVNGRDALIVFGGFDSNQKCLGDLWALMMDTFEWQELKTTGDAPCPRGGHRVFVHEHFVGVFGGEGDDDKRKDDLFVIDTDTLEWRELKIQDNESQNNVKEKGGRKAPSPRYCHSCSVVKSTGEIVLLGGRDEDSTLFGSVWTLNTFSLFLYQTRRRRPSFSTSLSCLLTPQFTQDLSGLMYSPSPLFCDTSFVLVPTPKEGTQTPKRKVN